MANFLIGIGGTGMRCIESFLHLCNIGMLDSEEINILLIDTDFNNGNKDGVRNLVDWYTTVKKKPDGKQAKQKDSFLSASINLYEFIPDYNKPGKTQTFKQISRISEGESEDEIQANKDLSSLVFSENVQNFKLTEGYRAQTHLGSSLMYHAITDHLREYGNSGKNSDLKEFVEKINHDDKIFILGSVFGGTGASSIPVIPRALADGKRLLSGSGVAFPKVRFGATLLTKYFEFSSVSETQLKSEKVIADSYLFNVSCQAALKYYASDRTVRDSYKRMYLIGWPVKALNYNEGSNDTKLDLGGSSQNNPPHIIELITATAAYDFFKDEDIDINNSNETVYRSINYNKTTRNLDFDFSSFFVKKNDKERFRQKLYAFTAFCSMIIQSFDQDVEVLIKNWSSDKQKGMADPYLNSISTEQYAALNNIITSFLYRKKEDLSIEEGWLIRTKKTFPTESFLKLSDVMFSVPTSESWGRIINEEDRHFHKERSLRNPFPLKPYPVFKAAYIKDFMKDEEVTSIPIETLLNRIYKTFNALHNFETKENE